jgi:lysophospholipase L1-like esterase
MSGQGFIILRKAVYGTLLFLVFLLAAEVTARVDDWLVQGIPLLETPNHEDNLLLHVGPTLRGKPNGRFKKWKLNAFGFRGPAMELEPAPGYTRVMILGASESFGLYESDDKEYPAQMAKLLGRAGKYEVVNAAVTGMTIKSLTLYWKEWASRFHSQIVVIYPSPLFYLNENAPGRSRAATSQATQTPRARISKFGSRLLSRLRDVFHVPDFIQGWRDQRAIAAKVAGKGEDWPFRTTPQDRLEMLTADLQDLVLAIEAKGARPVLLTHAIRCMTPPRPEDFFDLRSMRVNFPRPTQETILDFEAAANRRIRMLAARHGVDIIDVARVMNGKRDWFADPVHFTDSGAAAIALLIARHIALMPTLRPAPS